ncbi:MAG: DNA topoisomerase 4 subunit A [Lachnospiraceae bacterium]|nr:DNA topoisomerase 4 subunit A [Lachnospiraceae bacterium]
MNQNEDRIIRTDYSEIMQKNYIDYAMSVIVSRALPDVRDGLKPVQRRVLYDMWQLGTKHDRPYRKCARIVGDTMGKYHPHGDSSIYDSLVVMAQDFKKGQTLVDGHGNFGSIEGDGAAAMRYTEARLREFTEDVFLSDLDKEIVSYLPNFDETEKEPEILPARLPNILINGADGIAVGMVTSVPPHNLTEVAEAVKAFIRDDSLTSADLMGYIKGPDFPTGGIVVNESDLREIYETGNGKIRIRGKVELEKGKGGKQNLVITEIPYTMIGSGIGKFMSDVAALAESRQTTDIVDISNQSSKEGIRIVIELKRGADTEQLLNLLYKKTKLEDTFGVNLLVVSGGRPETMSLRDLIEASVDFQYDIAARKYEYLLAAELERRETLEGLIRATDVIDLIIEILRGSKNRKMAVDCLVMGITDGIRFKSAKSKKAAAALMFTERQANAILDMRLVKLIGLEIEALMKDYEETKKKIERYQKLLDDHDAMARHLIAEIDKMSKKYGRPRRTELVTAEAVVLKEKEVEEEEVVFCLDRFGYAKILDASVYEKNQEAAEEDNRYVFKILNTDKVAIFTNTGRMHTVKVSDLPVKRLRDKGIPIDNVSNYVISEEDILWVGPMNYAAQTEFLFVTKNSMIKRTRGSEFVSTVRTIAATKLGEGDELRFVAPDAEMAQVVLLSRDGYSLRFTLAEVPELKKTAVGVRGMNLSEGDELDRAYLLPEAGDFEVMFRGKSVHLNRLKLAKRGGKGTKGRK